MKALQLRTYPDPCLKLRTKKVEQFDNEIKGIIEGMSDMMYLNQGIGLAAPQVGLGLSVLVIDTGDGLMSFINPEIIEASASKSRMEEGCLSLPGVTVSVTRPEDIKVRAQDAEGGYFVKRFDGIAAKALQHEIDHLNGRLIIDYLDPLRHFLASRKLKHRRKNSNEKACEVICHVGKRYKPGP